MISFVHIIIEDAIPSDNEELAAKLALALNKHQAAIELLNKHYRLSDKEMKEFQENADSFLSNGLRSLV